MINEVVFEVHKLNKNFGAVKAVIDMDVSFRKGEVHCIIGENGSGKSTLVSMISGSLKPTSGSMSKNGIAYNPSNMFDARSQGVSILVQEQATIPGLTVTENIFLGREDSFSKIGIVNKNVLRKEARKVLESVSLFNVNPDNNIQSVSFEDRKLIEVAISLSDNADILILDETTTALSHNGREIIYKIIEQYRSENKTVIFISHDLEEVERYADTVTVMRDGAYVKTLSKEANDITVDNMRLNMIGRDLSQHYYRADEAESYEDEVVLAAENISYGKTLRGINIELKKGEILGVGGLTDSGMHDLGKALFGALDLEEGRVIVYPSGKRIKTPWDATSQKIGYLAKDRDAESLMKTATINENIVLSSFNKLKKRGYISNKSEKDLAIEYTDRLGIKMSSINQKILELSGGNKQKVVVAKWLANDSTILIMDCPTRGIDVGVKATIYHIMEDLKSKGISIIMISEELPELLGMSDRVLVMKEGKITTSFLRSERKTEHDVIQYMI